MSWKLWFPWLLLLASQQDMLYQGVDVLEIAFSSSEDSDVPALVPLHTLLAIINDIPPEGLSSCSSTTEKRKAESELETLCVVIFAHLICRVLRSTL